MSPVEPTYAMIARTPRVGLLVGGLTLAALGPGEASWRYGFIGLLLALLLSIELAQRARGELPWPALVALFTVSQLLLVLATGGIHSPLLVVFIPISVVAGGGLGARAWWVPAIQLPLIWALLLFDASPWCPAGFVPERIGGLRPLPGTLLWAGVLSVAVGMGNRFGRQGRQAVDRERDRLLAAERAATEAVAQRRRDLAALSGAIAHELKNPLTAILSLASFQHRRAPEGSREQEQLAVMLVELERMRETLREFLNVSRPIEGLARQRLSLAVLAGEVVALHQALAQERGVRLEAPVGEARVWGDRRKLAQVIENLLQNALQACGEGASVRVILRESDEHALVEILDEGCGLPEGPEERVFEPGVTTRPAGTGLGLSVCRAIAAQHGGEVWLARRPEVGTTATLALPRAAEEEP